MAAYSFLNVSATLIGPGGVVNLGAGAAVTDEGITIAATTDKNTMQIGADGQGQHSLIADSSGQVTVRLLKTSPVNNALQVMYDLQSASSALWGINEMIVTDSAQQDLHICQLGAFKKKAEISYKKEAEMIEWQLDFISISSVLGIGNIA